MAFLDRSFCGSDCVNHECYRNMSPAMVERGTKWWGGPDFPYSTYDFKTGCDSYKPPKDNDETK